MTDAALLVDRFVSASSATDALDSLQALLQGLSSKNEENRIPPEVIWQNAELLQALLEVLTTSHYKSMSLEEGPSFVCRIYLELWKQEGASSILLKEPSPGILLQSLLDVICNVEVQDYTRVLCLQIMNQACRKSPSLAQSQLLEIPNGLYRLASVFSEDNDLVRNELLGGVSQTIASWPSCAKIWVFGEVCDVLMDIAMKEGGLTGANVLVSDCLTLVEELVDPTLAEIVWASPVVAPNLAALLDLRMGSEFVSPPKKPIVSQTDDLDDILATGNNSDSNKKQKQQQQVLPKLTFQEEDLVKKVLCILGILLTNADSRPAIWKQHGPLCSLVWELALVSRPPPSAQPVCALPSPQLQQVALECTSEYFAHYETMKQHYGMDRLLYLACTGGNSSTRWNEVLGLSQAALHVLRTTLPEEEARQELTRTLAPPMMTDDHKPPPATVVRKLLNTVFENMAQPENDDSSSSSNKKHVLERRRINLVGALGAISIFFKSPTDREVLLGVSSSLVDSLLTCLQEDEDKIIRLALLRFACEWVVETPRVVQAFLASSHSIVFSVLLGDSHTSVANMTGFLLGLLLEYMADGEDEKHGGWTKQSIMQLFSKRKGGISGYTADLETIKSTPDLPWRACDLEWQLFSKWYSQEVLAIRRCVVHELTSGGESEEEEEEEEARGSSNHSSAKSMNRLVSQQAAELEELRTSLSEAKQTIETQEGQLAVWNRRVESTPTQLDEMLTEYTGKNAEMEKEMKLLKEQILEKNESVQSQLQERDDQIAQLQATVQEWQAKDTESRQERDDLRSELQGLTSAYATLEQEYHRREGPSAQGTAAAAPTGEASDDRPAQQPEGEVSHQEPSSSPELATLQAENARLRSDAQAADDWMAMAVQRMNDIGGQNQALQQEVATLREQWRQAELTGGVVAPIVTGVTQEQLDEEVQLREQVEQRLAEAGVTNTQLETEITSLRQQLEDASARAVDSGVVADLEQRLAAEEYRRQDLESQLQSAQRDTSTAMDSFGGLKSEKERLERMVASMESELRDGRTEISSLREARERLEQSVGQSTDMAAAVEEKEALLASKDSELDIMRSLVASKDEELARLKESYTHVDSADETNQELMSLRENVQSLSHDLEKARNELDDNTSRNREEIRKRDERIRELESSRPQGQLPPSDMVSSDAASFFGSGGTDSRDEEIRSLREANEASQEWMAKAVEHHQMLSDQVSALTEDKAALSNEIKELKQSASANTASVPAAARETIDRLERDLSERTTEVTDLGARIIQLESEVRIKETELEGVQERIFQCEQLQREISSLEDARDVDREKAKSLEEAVSQVVSEKEELKAQVSSLRQELDEKNALIDASAGASLEEMASLKQLLHDREAEMNRLKDELEAARDAFADADQLRITLQNARDESSRLRTELDGLKDKTASFDALQQEIQTLRETSLQIEADSDARKAAVAEMDRLRDEIASHRVEQETLTAERDNLKETVSKLESQLSEFQAWADAAQRKIAELQEEKDASQRQWTIPDDSGKSVVDVADSDLQKKVASLSAERDALRSTVNEMESQLSEFQSWSDAAQLKISELQNEKEALEQQKEIATEPDKSVAENAVMDDLRRELASSKADLDALTTEKDGLKERNVEMESQVAEFQVWSDAAQVKISELEKEKEDAEQRMKELEESSNEVGNLRDEITALESNVATLSTERDGLKETTVEMESQLSEFQEWSDAAQVKISELEKEKENAEQRMKELEESSNEVGNLRDEITSLESNVATLSTERDGLKETIVEMESQLSEFQVWSDAAQVKISELEIEKDDAEQRMKELEESSNEVGNLRDEITALESNVATLSTERDGLKETIVEMESQLSEFQVWSDAAQVKVSELEKENEDAEQRMKELEESSNEISDLRDEITALESNVATLSTERDGLKETIVQKESQLAEFQEWSDAAQVKISELQEDVDSKEQEVIALSQSEKESREQLYSIREDFELKSTQLSDAMQQVDELKAAKEGLDSQLEAAKLENENLIGKNSSLEQDLKVLETQCNGLIEKSNGMEAKALEREETLRIAEANAGELQGALEALQEQSASVVDEWKAQVEELESTVADLEDALQQQQAEASDVVEQWSARWSELDALKSDLERHLATISKERDELSDMLQYERANGGKEMLAQVQTDHDAERAEWETEKERLQARIDGQNEALSISLQNATAADDELSQMRATAEETVDAWKQRVSEMEDAVQDLEDELAQRREEASEAISQWESHCSKVEARVEELESELHAVAKEKEEVKLSMEKSIEPLGEQLEEERAARERLEKENHAVIQQIDEIKTQSEQIINQWKGRVQDLESSVAELEGQLEAQQEEATAAISQWETSCRALEEKVVQLEGDAAQSFGEADRTMNEELRSRQEEVASLTNQIDQLQKELSSHETLEEQSRELEGSLEAVRETLRMTEASLESKRELAENLEKELVRLRQEVESGSTESRTALALERAAREAAEKNLATLQETVSETEDAFVDLCLKEGQIISETNQSKEDFETKESQWNSEREMMSAEKDLLVQERDDLKATVGELQEELRDASDALQACMTDVISEKATEVASDALRYQMERLRSQIEIDQEACSRERNARLAAEKEVEALKTDLANVLGVIDGRDDESSRLQRMTMRASETMQRRERKEMEEVRKALERALHDLSTAQAAEAKALEDAAASRLQLSVCEQEVLAAKSDLAFLTQTLEETREAEASKAASLEYRISSLEDDRAVLRQFHQDELENLRNELTHVNMEKDRILHSLKESEKKNAAIVFSTSNIRESDGTSSPETELSRLRVEKAQLLTAAAEEGSRTESRIREAVAAHASSMEADIILERELRVAAEAAVEDIKFQMEQLESGLGVEDDTRDPAGENLNDSRSETVLDELSAELKRFKDENRSLSADNATLKKELAESKETSQAEIMELTDKWRRAQARAHMLESAGHFDAEVDAEVEKLRSNGGGQEPRNCIVPHENPAEDDRPNLSPVEAYDLIQQQKIAIQEERAMYLELLAEHDDLLALLAQQDLEKASLNSALSRIGGPEAVDAAMEDAEERVVKQFGKHIKLSS